MGPSGAKVPENARIGAHSGPVECWLVTKSKKIEIALKFTKEIPLKMLIGFKKN